MPQPRKAETGDNGELLKRIEAVEAAIKKGAAAAPAVKKEEPPVQKKKPSARLYVPIPEDELTYDYPTAKLARNWNSTVNTMKQRKNPYFFPLINCMATFDAEGLIILVPDDRYNFTQRTTVNHLSEIREAFQSVTGTDYTIKVARRSDFDDSLILNPFELPKRKGESAESESEQNRETVPEEKDDNDDPFDKFIEKFSDIIIDADNNISFDFDRNTEVGEDVYKRQGS